MRPEQNERSLDDWLADPRPYAPWSTPMPCEKCGTRLSENEILRFKELFKPFREWFRSPENSQVRKSRGYRVCLINEVETRPWDDIMGEPLYKQCDKCRLKQLEWNARMKADETIWSRMAAGDPQLFWVFLIIVFLLALVFVMASK